jgi:hypothetical protein
MAKPRPEVSFGHPDRNRSVDVISVSMSMTGRDWNDGSLQVVALFRQ